MSQPSPASAPAASKGSGKSCGCGCLGCFFGCLGTSLVLALVVFWGAWFYGPEIAAWVMREGGAGLTRALEGFVQERASKPPQLPPLNPEPARIQAVHQKVQAAVSGSQVLEMTEEEANLFMRTSLAQSGIASAGGPVYDAYLWLEADRARLVASLRGPVLARMVPESLPGPEGSAPLPTGTLKRLLEQSPHVNLEAGLRARPGPPVSLKPESVSLLGIPMPVRVIDGLLAEAAKRRGASGPQGLPLPGVQRLELRPGELTLEASPGEAGWLPGGAGAP